MLAVPHDRRYVEYVTAHVRELIDRYKPSVLWNDISWPTAGGLPELFAYYYNTVEDGVVNDRWNEPELARNVRDRRHAARRRATSMQALWPFIPEQRKRLTFAAPGTATSARPSTTCCTRDGAQVGAGPRRRALLRGQPARAARGHHQRRRS